MGWVGDVGGLLDRGLKIILLACCDTINLEI